MKNTSVRGHLLPLVACLGLLRPSAVTAQSQSLVDGNSAFALNLYGQLATNQGNLFFSPYSISTCMAMLYAGAAGTTETQMSQVLGFDTNQQAFASNYQQLQLELQANQNTNSVDLNIADALWTQEGFPFLPSFLQTATTQYQASLNQANFATQSAAATAAINAWVARETENKILNIIPPGAINPTTVLVLANAIYFAGVWTQSFAVSNTTTQWFFLSNGSKVQTPLMHQPPPANPNATNAMAYNYMDTAAFQAIELPYGANQASMLILLPTQASGLAPLEQELSPEFLSGLLAQMTPRFVNIYLPKFTLASSFNLGGTLAAMGMPNAFAPGVADFSGIDGAEDLYVSAILQKAWGQVNEAGTQAAAATVVIVGTSVTTDPPPLIFRADHPFLFIIRDTQSGSILFLGRLADPSQSAPTPMPQLNIAPSGRSLKVSWPYPSAGWKLLQSSDLTTTNWSSTSGISNDGTNNSFTLTPGSGNLFFRLSQ